MVASHDLFHGRGIGHSGQTLPFVESALSRVGKTRPICCVARHVLDKIHSRSFPIVSLPPTRLFVFLALSI